MSHHIMLLNGGRDLEMYHMLGVLDIHGVEHHSLMVDGHPCNLGNAYGQGFIDRELIIKLARKHYELGLIECWPANIDEVIKAGIPVRIFDHHRVGIDKAASMGPELYDKAASIGQLYEYLHHPMDRESKIVAASDHCFAAAVQGLCPDISSDEVLSMRRKDLMLQFDVDSDSFKSRLSSFYKKINQARIEIIGHQEVFDLRKFSFIKGYSFDLLALQMVLAQEKVAAIICFSHGKDGFKKIFLTGFARPDTVEYFLTNWALQQGLVELFGVPKRGYAGGYCW